MISILNESEYYILQSCQLTNQNILLRRKDNCIAYLTDEDANIILEHSDDEVTFNLMAVSFTYLNPITEKQE